MSKAYCFLFLPDQVNSDVVTSVLDQYTDFYQEVSPGLYFFSGYTHQFSMELLGLDEGVSSKVCERLAAKGIADPQFFTGDLSDCQYTFPVDWPE